MIIPGSENALMRFVRDHPLGFVLLAVSAIFSPALIGLGVYFLYKYLLHRGAQPPDGVVSDKPARRDRRRYRNQDRPS